MSSASLFEWTDQFSVGIEEVDDQHKILFDLINRLFMAALNRADHAGMAAILDDLVDYTRTHFALEEQLLAEAGYPDLAQHQADHQRFVVKLEAVVQKFMVEEKSVTFELINFLKHWLKEHILETDMAYARVLAKSNFSTESWARGAHAVVGQKNSVRTGKSWWKFWGDPVAH